MSNNRETTHAVDDFISDVFKDEFDQLLASKATLKDKEVYKDNILPVDIIQFVEDPYYLGGQQILQPEVLQALWDIEDPDVREVDLEVGKGCLPRGTPVWDPTVGAYKPIGYGLISKILGSDNGVLTESGFLGEVYTGLKECVLISCGSKSIVTSVDHKFNTPFGKVRAEDLTMGSIVATIDGIPEDEKPYVWSAVTHTEYDGTHECYDIIESEAENNFVASAFLISNSGKSECSAISPLYGVYLLTRMKNPHRFFGLSSATIMAAVNVSINEKQAKNVVFQSIKSKTSLSPYFQSIGAKELSIELEFPGNIRVFCGHSGSQAFLGYGTIRGVMDEVNYMFDNSQKAVAEELYGTLLGSMNTRFPDHYKLISVSSMTQPNTWLHQRTDEAERHGTEYVRRLRGMQVNVLSSYPDGRKLVKVITRDSATQAELAKNLAMEHQMSIVGMVQPPREMTDGFWETVIEARFGLISGL